MPRKPVTFTVNQPAWGGVTRWEPGSWDAHVGKLGWMPAGAPFETGTCVAVAYLHDGTVDLTYEPRDD
jgi:hypothetical protein